MLKACWDTMVTKVYWPDRAKAAFILRDDDISFFTVPQMLERIYGQLWQRGCKATLAVIPKHKAIDDLNVPPTFRGSDTYHSIDQNRDLLRYLKNRLCEGKIAIAQHGFSHEMIDDVPEFGISDRDELARRLSEGIRILNNALQTEVKAFVPPWEKLSKPALKVIRKAGMWTFKPSYKHYPSKYLDDPNAQFERFKTKFIDSYRRGGYFILVHHCWDYFSDWEKKISREGLYRHFQEALAFVNTHPNVWKTTLTEVVEWLVSIGIYDRPQDVYIPTWG